jgi:hypothetical protein
MGGERGDMPSQGAFSVDADRAAIRQLEDVVISSFGHRVLKHAAVTVQSDPTIDLGAKMLRDEHMPTLGAMVAQGALSQATTLSFNACPMITFLPSLNGMDSLRTLSLVRCAAMASLPDLSALPSLKVVKLEGCEQLAALPKLPDGVEWEDCHLPSRFQKEAEEEEK